MAQHEIYRVFINLFVNCLYALADLKKKNDDFLLLVDVDFRAVNKFLEITLRDNGPGIPDHVLEKAFWPFFTIKPPADDGTGIGLSLSYDIITAHKGIIQVGNSREGSPQFIIKIPVDL